MTIVNIPASGGFIPGTIEQGDLVAIGQDGTARPIQAWPGPASPWESPYQPAPFTPAIPNTEPFTIGPMMPLPTQHNVNVSIGGLAAEILEAYERGKKDAGRDHLTPKQVVNLLRLIRGGSTLVAIKEYRTITGSTLKDAKEAIDSFADAIGA